MTVQHFLFVGGFERGTARSRVPLRLVLLHTFLSNKEKYVCEAMTRLLFPTKQKQYSSQKTLRSLKALIQSAFCELNGDGSAVGTIANFA